MRIYVSMPNDWMVEGYERAADRVRTEAADISQPDAKELCLSAFEAVMWASAIAERFELHGDTRVQGLQHLRDRLIHARRGAAAPMYLDPSRRCWVWYPSEQLPPRDDSRPEPLRGFYDKHLAREPVFNIFNFFAILVDRTLASSRRDGDV